MKVHHELRDSASTALTETGFVNGRRQFSTPLHRIHTPWPITKKIVTVDHVGGPYGCSKFGADPSTGVFWASGWNITNFKKFILHFLPVTDLQVRPVDGFWKPLQLRPKTGDWGSEYMTSSLSTSTCSGAKRVCFVKGERKIEHRVQLTANDRAC